MAVRTNFRRGALTASIVWGLLGAPPPRPALADDETDHVAELSETMSSDHTERERIAAVTALARLASKPTLRPLVAALSDGSPTVRAIAAVGLGKLGHRASLPALRNAATGDADALVRKRAEEAVSAVCDANGIVVAPPKAKAGFGNQPRAVAPRPDLYVMVKSTSDDSPGSHDKKARKVHADLLRAVMTSEMADVPTLTSVAADAGKFGLDLRNVDLSITALEIHQTGNFVEVEAQIRLAISDENGRMLSFLSGGAKIQVPKRTYDAAYLPQLRKEALENAVRGLFGKLIDHLRRGAKA